MPLADISDDEEQVGRRNTYSPFGLPLRPTPVNVPVYVSPSILSTFHSSLLSSIRRVSKLPSVFQGTSIRYRGGRGDSGNGGVDVRKTEDMLTPESKTDTTPPPSSASLPSSAPSSSTTPTATPATTAPTNAVRSSPLLFSPPSPSHFKPPSLTLTLSLSPLTTSKPPSPSNLPPQHSSPTSASQSTWPSYQSQSSSPST